tara:strand:+ start:217 stop:453 length:237 start_codon:yes stop_codon:yes gene_type:complete
MTEFTITQQQRREFLESHNELRTVLHTIWECNDLWMSDVAKLEKLMHRLHQSLKFVRQEDSHAYMNWVLEEDNPPKEE